MTEEQINDMFKQGFDCSQVVLSALSSKLDIDEQMAKRVSACFGGGMFSGQTCGAVTGSYMAIGLKGGHCDANTPEIKSKMIELMGDFNDKFLEKYPSTCCKEMLGHDISNPDEMEVILEKGLLTNFCPKVVLNAIEILNEII